MNSILTKFRWPSLAQDLAVMTVPGSPLNDINQIYATYNIDEVELRNLLSNPNFQDLFQKELTRCKAEGYHAGVSYRFSSLSHSLSEKLFNDAMSSNLEGKDTIKLLELFMKAARLLETKEAPPQVNTQVNVSLALPTGLKNPKLSHMAKIK